MIPKCIMDNWGYIGIAVILVSGVTVAVMGFFCKRSTSGPLPGGTVTFYGATSTSGPCKVVIRDARGRRVRVWNNISFSGYSVSVNVGESAKDGSTAADTPLMNTGGRGDK